MTTPLQTQEVNMPPTPETMAAFLANRCSQDEEFEQAFRKDPKGSMERIVGKKFPEKVRVVICENDTKTWHVPLPSSTSVNQDLSDADVEKIVAGEFAITVAGAGIFGFHGLAFGLTTIAGIVLGTVSAGIVAGGIAATVGLGASGEL